MQDCILKIHWLRYSGNVSSVIIKSMLDTSLLQILGKSCWFLHAYIMTLNWLTEPKPMHRKSTRQAAAAQTTRKGSPCTARAPGKPQQPKRPEREARAPQERPASRSSPNDHQKGKPVHRKSARQAAAAQTTRKGSPCTARAPGKPQQPKRPDREARTPQERPASRSSPNDQQTGKPVHRRSAEPEPPGKKTADFHKNQKKNVVRMPPRISKKEIS